MGQEGPAGGKAKLWKAKLGNLGTGCWKHLPLGATSWQAAALHCDPLGVPHDPDVGAPGLLHLRS